MQPFEIKEFILKSIKAHSQDMVAVTAEKFRVARTTLHRYLNYLIEDKKVLRLGNNRQAKYYLADQDERKYKFKVAASLMK